MGLLVNGESRNEVATGISRFEFILPAGTDTLLCYLIPYYAYALIALAGLHVPGFALSGAPGLVKSGLFALLCVQVTKMLSHAGIRLKL